MVTLEGSVRFQWYKSSTTQFPVQEYYIFRTVQLSENIPITLQ
jgi:hypothetical protein